VKNEENSDACAIYPVAFSLVNINYKIIDSYYFFNMMTDVGDHTVSEGCCNIFV
jgi:hypothetical protein